ncbi:GNAT family N-acetyltransferase [Parvibaculum sp.]|jgi:RimJ/RimL family protein N-acetyltransferase|uniref:GNAT family N-acetyltransferase n=1 Tax=Parvibaculum sp. TaxID=2024848 RepID=UPI001B0BE053|nr:GNAT family N-acetyltransferase [Parvibaculum sp.]MBO6634121.1 GNAT family N-acetyltransferase [Parvibaculum sp.]MBO6677220.1 GNAT family N-acetyltransferase [Parvibaculum sp.]MBO6686084.1 GNAT family N-acetyltransferase [Parvibaculum sp.]MBO6904641.1 GNAT family N-acetyltransferase [Parvibaculum sp.]
MQEELKTERLSLRPLCRDDAERLADLANNWNVARMLSRMPYPYSLDMAHDWICKQEAMRAEGEEFVYAIANGDGFIGTCGVQAHADGTHEIGYWIGEPYWNRGYASEAARAALAEAVARFGTETLISGHFWENHASGRVLTKLGFRYTGEDQRWCLARQEKVRCLTMRLARMEA